MVSNDYTLSQSPYKDIGTRVSDVMTCSPVTISPEATIGDCVRTMGTKEIHQLPVCLHDGTLVGIITERDLRSALASSLAFDELELLDDDQLKKGVESVMTREVSTALPDEPLGLVIRRLLDVRVGSLPVVDAEAGLVCILSRTDILAEAAGLFDSILTEIIGAELNRLRQKKL